MASINMKKEKKISIKYYLNIEGKPTVKEGQEYYPLYMRVVYNRKVNKVKLLKEGMAPILLREKDFEGTHEHLKDLPNSEFNKLYCEPEKIKELIRIEINNCRTEFNLRGLGDLLGFYRFCRVPSILGWVTYEEKFDNYVEKQICDKLKFTPQEARCLISGLTETYDPIALYNRIIPGVYDNMPEELRIEWLSMALLQVFSFRKSKDWELKDRYGEGILICDWVLYGGEANFKSFLQDFVLSKAFENANKRIQETIHCLKFKEEDIDICIQHINLYVFNIQGRSNINEWLIYYSG